MKVLLLLITILLISCSKDCTKRYWVKMKDSSIRKFYKVWVMEGYIRVYEECNSGSYAISSSAYLETNGE